MKLDTTGRGFEVLFHDAYPPPATSDDTSTRLVGQSSAIGDYDDSFSHPGSSFLWVGDGHHLNREEVAQLVTHLQSWLMTGSLEVTRAQPDSDQGERP